jgi:hypothetical protein
MAMHWTHKNLRTDKSTEHVSGNYRVLAGVPIDGTGFQYCPRCDAFEDKQYERGIVIQSYLGGALGTLHAYFHCYQCKLDYYYCQDEVAL